MEDLERFAGLVSLSAHDSRADDWSHSTPPCTLPHPTSALAQRKPTRLLYTSSRAISHRKTYIHCLWPTRRQQPDVRIPHFDIDKRQDRLFHCQKGILRSSLVGVGV